MFFRNGVYSSENLQRKRFEDIDDLGQPQLYRPRFIHGLLDKTSRKESSGNSTLSQHSHSSGCDLEKANPGTR